MFYEEIRTNKTRAVLHINLFIMYSVQQQIHFNGNVFGTNAVFVTRDNCTHCRKNINALECLSIVLYLIIA